MVSMVFENFINIVKDSVFPNICLCGKWGEVLCEDCYESIRKNKKDLCPICRRLSEFGKTCQSCRGKSGLTGVMIFGKHEGILKDAIWNLKYESVKDLYQPLASLIVEKYGEFCKYKNFLVTFVPASKERLNWRGYNQSELLAKEVAVQTKLEIVPLLEKIDSIPQVGLKKSERLRNISGRLNVIDESIEINNKKILVVDDVYTTGATLEECAKILRQNGAREVWGMVLSRD